MKTRSPQRYDSRSDFSVSVDEGFGRCSICFDVVKDNLDCNICHNLFCKECINKWKKSKNYDETRCPQCKSGNINNFTHNVAAQRLIDHYVQIICPYCQGSFSKDSFHFDSCREKRTKGYKLLTKFKRKGYKPINITWRDTDDLNFILTKSNCIARNNDEKKSSVTTGANKLEGKMYFVFMLKKACSFSSSFIFGFTTTNKPLDDFDSAEGFMGFLVEDISKDEFGIRKITGSSKSRNLIKLKKNEKEEQLYFQIYIDTTNGEIHYQVNNCERRLIFLISKNKTYYPLIKLKNCCVESIKICE